jgi:hypothetical protein
MRYSQAEGPPKPGFQSVRQRSPSMEIHRAGGRSNEDRAKVDWSIGVYRRGSTAQTAGNLSGQEATF